MLDRRQMVFIDGQNIFYSAKDYFGEEVRIDLPRLIDHFAIGDLKETYFFDSHLRDQDKSGFYNFLRENGFVVESSTTRYRDHGPEAVGIDVGISTEMVGRAHMDEYDEALLYSADTDFIPAMEHVQEHVGKDVAVVQFEDDVRERMEDAADRFITLDDEVEDFVYDFPER
ncbi:NYN domain-containing protein [Haloarcula litorea]|uniref:NYN domain-containing protein n=1 Tax=Haloarcula litorea TaxID=3032579 RepID=UPI0023E7DA1E|nr:NYN domain-containing protein [Halomicroarcula sp. GDY20]